jgi:hypothetical protein
MREKVLASRNEVEVFMPETDVMLTTFHHNLNSPLPSALVAKRFLNPRTQHHSHAQNLLVTGDTNVGCVVEVLFQSAVVGFTLVAIDLH